MFHPGSAAQIAGYAEVIAGFHSEYVFSLLEPRYIVGMQGNLGRLHGPEILVVAIIYVTVIGASIAAVVVFLRALWRIGDGLFRISRTIESKQAGNGYD